MVVGTAKHFYVDPQLGCGYAYVEVPHPCLSYPEITSLSLSSCLHRLFTSTATAAIQLLRALLWLLAGSEAGAGDGGVGDPGAAAKEEVLEIASQLAAHQDSSSPSSSFRQESAQGLFARHFTDLLACVVGNAAAVGETGGAAAGARGGEGDAGWGKGSRRRGGFEALLRSAPRAVGEHLGEVMPIFRGLLHDATRWGGRQIYIVFVMLRTMSLKCFGEG